MSRNAVRVCVRTRPTHQFAQDNIGRNFRRPEPKDEAAKKATEIFRKYSSSSSYSNEEEDKENEEISSNTPGQKL